MALHGQALRRLVIGWLGCLVVGACSMMMVGAVHAAPARTGEPARSPVGDDGGRGDDVRGDGRRRAAQVWEVHLILPDGRRQILRGVREPSRERRVVRLHVDAAPGGGAVPGRSDGGGWTNGAERARGDGDAQGAGSPARSGKPSNGDDARLPLRPPIEHIEGGHVAPKPVRGASGRRRVILQE
ncbi:MAG: hypothetical protein QM766_01840 [Burkholderiaceae bacterium]